MHPHACSSIYSTSKPGSTGRGPYSPQEEAFLMNEYNLENVQCVEVPI